MRKGRLAARICAAALACAMLSSNVRAVYAAEDSSSAMQNGETDVETVSQMSTLIPVSLS